MSLTKTSTLQIRTPEGIAFSLLLAGPVTRFLAWLVDVGIVIAATVLINSVAGILGVLSPDFAQALAVLLFFGLQIGYGIGAEWWWRGQTVGKRLLRLQVMDAAGLRLHFSQIVIRNLLRFVDGLPAFYLVGGLACLISKRAQRLGDLAANTIVIRNPKVAQPDLDQLLAGKFNSLREHPHLEARLRQRVSPGEAAVALQALVRRDDLEPAARVELFAELAAHFKSLVEFPAESIEGIADEQYVRNVVDLLFRPRREKTDREEAGRKEAQETQKT
ncbi:MAG: RDD family protein [Verrucomicrobia bacterium]|nr:RDD family protein [Verrucomicrobiota bacterium]